MGKDFHVDCFRCEVSDSDIENPHHISYRVYCRLFDNVMVMLFAYRCCQHKLLDTYIHFNCNPTVALFLHFENQVVFAFFTCNCWSKTYNVDWWHIM